MKKRICSLILAALLLMLASCGNGKPAETTDLQTVAPGVDGTTVPSDTDPVTEGTDPETAPPSNETEAPVTEAPETSPVVIPDTPANSLDEGWKLFRFADYACDYPAVEGVVTGYYAEFDIDYPAQDDGLGMEAAVLKNTVEVPMLQFGGESHALNKKIREDIAGAYGSILVDLVTHAIGEQQMVFNLSYDYSYADEYDTLLQLRVKGVTAYSRSEIRENVYVYYFNTETGRELTLDAFLTKLAGQRRDALSELPAYGAEAEYPLSSAAALLSVLRGEESERMPVTTAVLQAQFDELIPPLPSPAGLDEEILGGVYWVGNTAAIYLNRYWGDESSPYHIGTDYVVLPDQILPIYDQNGEVAGYNALCLREQKGQSILSSFPIAREGASSNFVSTMEPVHTPLSGLVKTDDSGTLSAIFTSPAFESTAFGDPMQVSGSFWFAAVAGENSDMLAIVNQPNDAPNPMERFTGIYGMYIGPGQEYALVDADDILRQAKTFFQSDYDFVAAGRTEQALDPLYEIPRLTLTSLVCDGSDLTASFTLRAATGTHEANLLGTVQYDLTSLKLAVFFDGGCTYGQRLRDEYFEVDSYFMPIEENAPAWHWSTVFYLAPDGTGSIYANYYEGGSPAGSEVLPCTYRFDKNGELVISTEDGQQLRLTPQSADRYNDLYTIHGSIGGLFEGQTVKQVIKAEFDQYLLAQEMARNIFVFKELDGEELKITVALAPDASGCLEIPDGYFVEEQLPDGSYASVQLNPSPTFRAIITTLQPGDSVDFVYSFAPYLDHVEGKTYRICLPAVYDGESCVLR